MVSYKSFTGGPNLHMSASTNNTIIYHYSVLFTHINMASFSGIILYTYKMRQNGPLIITKNKKVQQKKSNNENIKTGTKTNMYK